MPSRIAPPITPTARQARDHISHYLDRALRGQSTRVLSRGKHIATIGPLPRRHDTSVLPSIAASDLKSGRRTLVSLLRDSAYVVTRNGRQVAILSAVSSGADRVASRLGDAGDLSAERAELRALLQGLKTTLDKLPGAIVEAIEEGFLERKLNEKRAELARLEERQQAIADHQRQLTEIWQRRVELARRLPGPRYELSELCESWEGML